jgi:prolyl-tRNA editing enzyme YbaK/EbsC (Cys-tRNA(Pro) deacylase)
VHPNAQRVQDALTAAGGAGQVRELALPVTTAAQAAAALGCEVGAIANSLVFTCDGGALLVLTSGGHRVDTAHLARVIGARRIGRADPRLVRDATGQPIGGVAPLGHPRPVPTYVDAALADHAVVWAAGGTPRAVFPTSFAELVRVTAGTPVTVEP